MSIIILCLVLWVGSAVTAALTVSAVVAVCSLTHRPNIGAGRTAR